MTSGKSSKHMVRRISFVVAVYQNELALTETYKKIKSLFAENGALHDFVYEIVFVDDGSRDRSLEEIRGIKANDSSVVGITFTRNFGQMAAMLAGFAEASGDAVINISADLQDPVDLIPQMVTKWSEGAEIVACYRTDRADGFAAKMTSRIAYGIIRLSLPQIPAGGFDFVLMDRKVMDAFNAVDVRHRFFQGDLLWTGYRLQLIPYVRQKRTIGRSQYNFAKRLKNFMDAILDASYLPIRFISLCGFAVSVVGVIYAMTIVASWAMGHTPFDGWAPLMIVNLCLSGLIMIMLGVIGEYVWRINEEVRKKPNYIVREKF